MELNIHLILSLLSGVLIVISAFPYIADILNKKIRPNVVSWGGWTLLMGIAVAAQITEGASWSVVVPLLCMVNTSIVTVLAIKFGYTKLENIDKAAIALAIVAMLGWFLTNEPLVAIVFSIIADAIVAIPTIVKTWKDPSSEPIVPWGMVTTGTILGLLATDSFALHNLLFPLYLICINSLVTLLALRQLFSKDIIRQ